MRIKTRSLFIMVFLLSLLFLTFKILLNNGFDLETRNDISALIVQKFDPALGIAQPLRNDVVKEAKNLEESPVKLSFIDLDNKIAFDKPGIMAEQKQEPIKPKPMKTYLDLNKCSVQYDTASKTNEANGLLYNYSLPADEALQSQTIIRGVMFFFQRSNAAQFMPEFKWLYRSWIEIVRNSPKAWHTDLIVFVDLKDYKNDPIFTVFEEFGCLINKPRVNKTDKSMCILIDFISMRERITEQVIENQDALFQHFYNEADPFSDDPRDLRKLYALLSHLNSYGYTDSILMAFDGYKYLKDSYDFLIRTDLDIFLTPLFGKWLPRHCNDFIVGNGGYSTDFNTRRMGRIANNLGLNYADKSGLGSTWYSTPRQFRIVSYFTLISMVYLSNYEFTESERKEQIGTLNWPDWHYGVLLLYGQHLAINHLWDKHVKFVKLNDQFDVPSSASYNLNNILHIHTYHGEELFCKFFFKEGRYDNMTVAEESKNMVNYYCLAMALESKKLTPTQMKLMLNTIQN